MCLWVTPQPLSDGASALNGLCSQEDMIAISVDDAHSIFCFKRGISKMKIPQGSRKRFKEWENGKSLSQ